MTLKVKQVITITLGLVVAAVMIFLGLWQMAAFQRSMADVATERAEMPTVSLAASVELDGSVDDIYGRRVEFSGSYLPENSLLVGTNWPMRVATLFRLEDGRHVAVIRGLTSDPDFPLQDPLPSDVEVEGIFTAGDKQEDDPIPTDAPADSAPSLRLPDLVQVWPQPLISGYVTLEEAGAAEFGLEPAPVMLPEGQGSAMHQGYALQWWVFAAASVAFSIMLARGFGKSEQKARNQPKGSAPSPKQKATSD